MTKPKDVQIQELKDKLAKYAIDPSITRFLVSLKRQIDNFSDVMDRVKPDEESLISSKDKSWERIFKLIEKAPQLMATMKEAEKHILSQRVEGEEKKKESGTILEEMLRDGKG